MKKIGSTVIRAVIVVFVCIIIIFVANSEYRAYSLRRERELVKTILDSNPEKYRGVRVVAVKRFANGLEGSVASAQDLKILNAQLDAAGVNQTIRNVQVK